MDKLSSECFITAFSKNAAPVLRVSDGATVRIATKDCYMDNLRAENDPRSAAKGPAIGCNPASGPIFVEGAQPGDTLKCEILAIDVGDYASMRISNRGGLMADRVTAPIVRCIPLKDGYAELAGVRMPLDPMIGVIGAAPEGEDVDTESPGAHGGNMDTRHIRAGSTLYLPVAVEGALFALGDVHARMGDGEICICGLECPAQVTVRLSVVHGKREKWPMLKDESDRWYAIASAADLDAAAKLSADAMMDFIERRVAIDHNELILLMSLVCHLEISQVVDPLLTARTSLDPFAFPNLTF